MIGHQLEKATGKRFHVDTEATPQKVELVGLPAEASETAVEAAVRALGRRMNTKE